MPSQINNPGNIGYGTGTTVSANYLKAKPSTRFGTRQLAFYDVAITGVDTNFRNSDSLFAKAVRGVQIAAEVYAVGTPASGHFMVVVAQDTANDGDNTDAGLNAMAKTLEQTIGLSSTVTAKHLNGSGFASGLMNYGDTRDGSTYFDESDAI